jgi:Domain of unknown function (DUF5668)
VARPFRSEGLVLGLLLVALGSAWMASNLGRLDLLSTLRTWWPASLVVWGAVELVAFALHRNNERRSSPDRASTGTQGENS